MTAEVEIRPGSTDDLTVLVTVLGERHWFTDRLARQHRGSGVVLVAWLEGRPVGEVFLECEPATEPEVRRQLPSVPRLDHLEVPGPFQGRGIATEALRLLVERAREDGRWGDIHAFTGASNGPSNAVCRKGGFTYIGEETVHYAGRRLRCNHWVLDATPPAS